METVFLVCLFIVLYTYLGYGFVLFMAVTIRRLLRGKPVLPAVNNTLSVTVIVAACNEASCIEQKINNCLELLYPTGRCRFIFVTDGSVDETPVIVSRYPQVVLLHQPERQGKTAAIDRAMQQVDTELVVFTDANTLLNPEALLYISRHYSDPGIGAVAGEKKVMTTVPGATAAEGWYWQYESTLKKWESELYTVMGAAGELFSIRTTLYEPPPVDTLLDDFAISSAIALSGSRIAYEPGAVATEPPSRSIQEEWKRKVRIAAGGVQMLTRSGKLLAVTRPILCFEYISHRVLRWIAAPYMLIAVLVINAVLLLEQGTNGYLYLLFIGQVIWYTAAVAGWLLQTQKIKAGWLYTPFYFCMMNIAMIAGMLRILLRRETVLWEKTRR